MPAIYPSRVSFVNHVTCEDWSALARAGRPVPLPLRRVLFWQEEQSRNVFVVLSGAVKVFRSEANGSQTLLTVRSTGDLIGDMAALDGTPRSASATVLRPGHARLLTNDQFAEVINSRGLDRALRQYTNARLRESDEQRVEIASLPVRQRLARALLRLASTQPGQGREAVLDLGLSQDALAQLIGASRNAVVAELAAFRRGGIVRTESRRMHLCNVTMLSGIAYAPSGSAAIPRGNDQPTARASLSQPLAPAH